jgi:arylsulfatase A-like enzyme
MNRPGLGRGAPQKAPWTLRRFIAVSGLLAGVAGSISVGCGGRSPSAPTLYPTPAPPAPTPIPSPRVAVISVDGLRADALGQAAAPHIHGLARRGSYTWKAQTVSPSMTLPAHVSMVTGFLPPAHGISWDDFKVDKGNCTVPTIFAIAKAAGLRTVMVVGKEKFRHLDVEGTLDSFVLARRGDVDVANEAIVQVQLGFDLMLAHFPDVDIVGHAQGWMSAAYLQQVTAADEAIGRLLESLPAETTVILTSDHGGKATVHGSTIPEDMTIPWIVVGPRIRQGRELARPVRTVDTAATVLHLLGLRPSEKASGTVVSEALATE